MGNYSPLVLALLAIAAVVLTIIQGVTSRAYRGRKEQSNANASLGQSRATAVATLACVVMAPLTYLATRTIEISTEVSKAEREIKIAAFHLGTMTGFSDLSDRLIDVRRGHPSPNEGAHIDSLLKRNELFFDARDNKHSKKSCYLLGMIDRTAPSHKLYIELEWLPQGMEPDVIEVYDGKSGRELQKGVQWKIYEEQSFYSRASQETINVLMVDINLSGADTHDGRFSILIRTESIEPMGKLSPRAQMLIDPVDFGRQKEIAYARVVQHYPLALVPDSGELLVVDSDPEVRYPKIDVRGDSVVVSTLEGLALTAPVFARWELGKNLSLVDFDKIDKLVVSSR